MAIKKILFRLTKDSDAYPPLDIEGVWCEEVEPDRFVVDNIPFFTRQVSLGDLIDTQQINGELFYASTRKRSDNSLVRVVLFNGHNPSVIRSELAKMGCSTEQSHLESLIAINVPPTVDIKRIRQVLEEGCIKGFWDYEEPILRQ